MGTAGAPTDGTFCSYEQVTDVLRELYTQKETPGELLEQLQDLSLTGVSPDSIGTYRDGFMRLAAGISQQLCSDEARCVLIVSKMPEPIQFGLAVLEDIKQPRQAARDSQELAHRIAGPCQKWWEERQAALVKGKAKQPRSESFAEAAARPAKGFALTLLVAPAHALLHSRGQACQISLASQLRRSRPLPTQACASAAAGLGTAGARVLTARGKPQPLTQTNLQLLALWWLNLLFCLMMHLFSLLLTCCQMLIVISIL